MRDSGPIIISRYGAACMRYSEEFSKKMQEEGYENPFARQQALARKMFKKILMVLFTTLIHIKKHFIRG